jgi:membrane-associated phospholipid phosphatase
MFDFRMAGRPVFGLALVSLLLASGTVRAAPALSPASSAEFQKLLAVQVGKRAVHFNEHKMPTAPQTTYQRLFAWNEVALDTTAIDHTPVPPGGTYVFGQQFGPTRASRAMAIIHIAMFEAVNAVYQEYRSYAGVAPVSGDVSVDYAIAQSAHDALVWLYPSQQPRLDALLAADVATIQGDPAGLAAGKALGQAAAAAIIALRTNDGSQIPEPVVGVNFTPIGGVGHWEPDPVSGLQTALGAYWGQVKPFVLTSGSQFRPAAPPALNSQLYTLAYYQVESLGGDPRFGTPSFRTAQQTMQGIFWTYDGVPNICAPPRLYNQLARTLAFQQGLPNVEEAARYLAMFNTVMADAAIAAWDAKYYYQFWRPVTGIRYTGNQGNPYLQPNPAWYPLGGQATNTTQPNFTPPFPAYPSGHAVFGGGIFEVLRSYFTDNTPFTFVSDEFNGENYSDTGQLQKLEPVSYRTLSAAEYDNLESRIWIGVHWQFDGDVGDAVGRQVGDWVLGHAFQKAHGQHAGP